MTNNKKIQMHNAEMAAHADSAAQFLDSFVTGKYIPKELARETLEYVIAEKKRNIEANPYATDEEKEEEIRKMEVFANTLKVHMGM